MNFQMQRPGSSRKPGWERLAGLAIVLALHGVVAYGLLQARLIPAPEEAATLFVNFIAPPPPPLQQQKPPAKPAKPEPPRPSDPHPHLVVKAPAAPNDYVMPAPPLPSPAPVIEAPPPAPQPPAPIRPVGPVSLSGELALACPTRTPPAYPAMSRRMGESGKVVLRVELDAEGRVAAAQVASSSGFKRLDEAALNAVRNWRCNPPMREGQAVRAVAMQPFQFNLE